MYTVLARKYRPETFEDVVGQDSITRTIANAILKERVAHAFLFSGPRGVGKTSMARILAKALNCKKGPTPIPCLTCEHCAGITKGNAVDVVEIDAASNRGIDHIRALRENVRYAPVSSRHKIYIIDEVHMLTTESFNALLKTLEEPPAHVKFIFATTEPQKMPETVRSRCQCFEFRRISHADITARLESIARKESIAAEVGVLQRIAVLSRGGLRDAESLLDQVASLGEGRATFDGLNALTGRLSPSDLGDLVDAILDEDAGRILDFVNRVFAAGTQGEDLLRDLIDYWRALMMAVAGSAGDVSWVLPGLEARCGDQANRTDLDRILVCLQISLETLRKGRWFDDERILTEMALLKMARLSHTIELSKAIDRLGRKGQEGGYLSLKPAGKGQGGPAKTRGASGNPAGGSPGTPKGASLRSSVSLPGSKTPPIARAENPASHFGLIVSEVEKDSKTLASYLKRLEVRSMKDDHFALILPHESESGVFEPDSPLVTRKLTEASRNVFARPFSFSFTKSEATGRESIPPIVQKTRELFDGDLI